MVRAAATRHGEDDDWGQAGTLVREVMDDKQRDRLVHNVIQHVCNGVKEPVLSRVFEYWNNIDPDVGKRVEEGVRARFGM
jgi:catalase